MRAVIFFVLASAALGSTCAPGTYTMPTSGGCPNSAPLVGTNCCACAAGTYNVHNDRASCVNCMVGRYSTVPQATSPQVCKVCSAGWYHPTDDATFANEVGASSHTQVCKSCPAGTYNPNADVSGNEASSCQECGAGRYNPNANAVSASACIKCTSPGHNGKQAKKSGGSFVTGATADEDACEAREHDCIMNEWSEWGRCTLMCGGGTQTRSRTMEVNAFRLGTTAGCRTTEERTCNTAPCSSMDERYPQYSELANGLWWEMDFPNTVGGGLPPGAAECRRQKNDHTGPFRFESLNSDVQNGKYNGDLLDTQTTPVDGWCCKQTDGNGNTIGSILCREDETPISSGAGAANPLFFQSYRMSYDPSTGKVCKANEDSGAIEPQYCAQVKPIFVHKRVCAHTTCVVEEHTCTEYSCSNETLTGRLNAHLVPNAHLGGFCPNKGIGACDGRTHTSIRVSHPGHNETENDGHFCHVTSHHASDPTQSTCTCYCLDVYKRQSTLDSRRYQIHANHQGGTARTAWKAEYTTTAQKMENGDQTDIVNPHFNGDGYQSPASAPNGPTQTHGKRWTN